MVGLVCALAMPAFAGAADGFFLDFGRVKLPAVGQWEVAGFHLRMDDHIDLLDFREREVSAQTARTFAGLGDLKGARVIANYGLGQNTRLQGGYTWRNLHNGLLEINIDTYELALGQRLLAGEGAAPTILLQIGGRINRAGDQTIRSVSDIDLFVKRLNRNYTISQTPTHLVIGNGPGTAFFPKATNPPLEVVVEDMADYTPFLGLACGWRLGDWEPALLLEVGRTWVDSRIDSNINAIVGTTLTTRAAEFPLDLERTEHYAKLGFNLYGPGPWGTFGNLRYEYQRLDRPDGLTEIRDNHLLKGDLILPLNSTWALNLGATYYRRQLNGVVPFLYNRYSQTTFDHDYGIAHLGVIARF